MNEGKVYFRGSVRRGSRRLLLEASQVLLLKEYVDVYRMLLGPLGDELIPGSVVCLVSYLFKCLRGDYGYVENALQLRGSVIRYWLSCYHKREVQYMAGHKQLSSTEHYDVGSLDNLGVSLDKHHPLC